MKKNSMRTFLCATAVISSMFTLTACSKVETTNVSGNTETTASEVTEQSTSESTQEVTDAPEGVDTPEMTDASEETDAPETTETPEATETSEPEVAGMIFSHKEEYATDLYELIISLPEEKPTSTLKQRDVDCDTLQWFNATYSVFTYQSEADYHLIGGFSDETGIVDSYVSDGLEQSWGITDRASAIESIAWLAYEGHATEYNEILHMMYDIGMLGEDENELARIIYAIGEEDGWTEQECREVTDYYEAMRRHYEQCGENGIDAWDYCRIMQISGSCYYAGYLTLAESLTIQLATAKVIQDEFDSWDAMNTSYLRGYYYWTYGSTAAYAHRLWAYQDLQKEEDCPFVILDFNMELEKFW